MRFVQALCVAASLAFSTVPALAERPVARNVDEVPSEVRRVITVSTQLVENQLRTKLDGRTEGYVVVDLQIETRDGFHIYADKAEFWTEADAWLGQSEWKLTVIGLPEARGFVDPVSHTLKQGYSGQAVFRLRLEVPTERAKPPDPGHPIPLVTHYQACSEKVCLLPVTQHASIALGTAAQAANGSVEESRGWMEQATDKFRTALGGGGSISLSIILLLLAAGAITAFTPCVYPLYPITLGLFARWSQASHIGPLWLSLSYCAGLTASYAVVGVLSAASGAVFGSLTQTAPFLIGMGLLILLSAVFFSGLLNFPMPALLVNAFSKPDTEDPAKMAPSRLAFKAAFMGASLGVVASPCVGPVLVVLIAWLGSTKASWGTGLLLLSSFGAGMSLPFLILGYAILKAGVRPSLGRYTPYIKHAGTVLMAASSLFFLVPGFKLLSLSSHSSEVKMEFTRADYTHWDKSKWTVMDFRADWCAACLELERETFTHKNISPLFESGEWNMVTVDMTQPELEPGATAAKSHHVVSLPSVLVFAPGGMPCPEANLYGFEGPELFLKRLQDAKQTCAPSAEAPAAGDDERPGHQS